LHGRPLNVFALEELRFITGKTIEPYVELERYIKNFILAKKGRTKLRDVISDETFSDFDEAEVVEEVIDLDNLRIAAEDAPVIKLVNTVLSDAATKMLLIYILNLMKRYFV